MLNLDSSDFDLVHKRLIENEASTYYVNMSG
jgi:hypothetical protein